MKVFNRSIKLGGESIAVNDIDIQVLEYNVDGDILLCTGTTVPTADSSGYAKGCLFIKTDAADGTKGLYENIGISTASDFNLIGDVVASELALAEGSVLVGNSSGVAEALAGETDAQILIGNGTTVVSVAVSGAITIANTGAVTIADDAVSVEHLDDGILPSHVVKFAGQHTTVGGDAAESATVTGALATDIVIASIEDDGTNNVTLLQSAAAENAVNFTMSGDPGSDCIINYMVLRAVS